MGSAANVKHMQRKGSVVKVMPVKQVIAEHINDLNYYKPLIMEKITKPKYPFALYSFTPTIQKDVIIDRAIIKDDIDEYNFNQKNRDHKILKDNLTKEELKTLSLLVRIQYKIPKWGYILGAIAYSIIIFFTSNLINCNC